MNKTFILFLLLLPFLSSGQFITKFNPQELYEAPGGIFDIDSLRTISIDFYNPNYHKILVDNWFADNGERLPAKIEFSNGVVLDSVAIRYKGNSTFYITNSYNIPKLPLNLDFNDHISGQKLMGQKKVKLANSMFDVTFVKEILGYSIYQKYLPSPEVNLMRVETQGKYLGLYVNIEPVNKQFLTKHFNEKDGVLVKCDPVQRYRIPGPSGNSDLLHLGTDSTLYYNHYDLKSDYGWKEFVHMIDVLNHHPDQIDSVLNVDRILWAFAVNQVICNFDTYNGLDQRNYYMYQTGDGLFQMIPWDVSESFINAMLGDLDNPNDLYNYDPYKGEKSWWYPLSDKLVGDPTSKYGQIYTAHLRTVLEESLDSEEILNFIKYVQEIAETAVASDPNNIWGMNLYRSNVYNDFSFLKYSFAGIMNTIYKRRQFLKQHKELKKEAPLISDVNVIENNGFYSVTATTFNAEKAEFMLSTNSYNSKFKSLEMNDEGINGDVKAGDGIFSVRIPNTASARFYIRASNKEAIRLSPERAEYEFYTLSLDPNEIKNAETNEVSLSPNPTRGIVYVKDDVNVNTEFEVYTATGIKVLSGTLSPGDKKIDLTGFSNGVYFVRIGNQTTGIVKSN